MSIFLDHSNCNMRRMKQSPIYCTSLDSYGNYRTEVLIYEMLLLVGL